MAVAQSNVLVAKSRLAAGDAVRGLISLRDRSEFEGAIDEKDLWLRVDSAIAQDAVRALSLLPRTELFCLDEQQRLTPINRSVPSGLLPSGLEWKPISQLTRLWLPALLHASQAGKRPAAFSTTTGVQLEWVHSEQYAAPGGLLCSFSDWSSYVLKNIRSKWRTLRFACRPSLDVESCRPNKTPLLNTLVVGEPIPSIPGVRLANCEQVLTPVAFTWSPAVPAKAVRRAFGVSESDWLLWESQAAFEVLSDNDFIATTRVSIRATAEALAQDGANASTESDGP